MTQTIKPFPHNIFVENLTNLDRLQALATSLWPVRCETNLVRIGSNEDGGYLLPNDFMGITVCFSPGVEFNSSFEESLFRLTGITSHLADFSVEGPPSGYKPKSFLKKFLGPVSNHEYTTLHEWVLAQDEWHSPGDFILQCDIEGGEYLTLLAAPDEVLSRFRIIVIEVHNVELWASSSFFRIVEAFFEKILAKFWVVHNHPNNHGFTLDLGGFLAPQVFELTLIRKDRTETLGFRRDFPHFLDRACLGSRIDLALPGNWFAPG
jgi:hypothetical protein